MKNKMKFENKKLYVILFFAIFLAYGLLTVGDYGVSADELMQREHCLIMYKYLVPSVSNIVTDTVNFPEVLPLGSTGYYGVALQLPTVFIEHMTGFTMPMDQVLFMRHVYVFLAFFIAAIYLYKTVKYLYSSSRMALLGTVIFILCPRILGHNFFNVKDALFMSVFTINIYYALRFFHLPSLKNLPGLALSTILCVNTRVVGAIVLAVCLGALFIKSVFEKKIITVLLIIATGMLSILAYILITPTIWSNPIQGIINTVKTFSNYPWEGSCYFMGEYIKASEIPWYYLPLWMFITIPFSYQILAVFGLIGSIKKKDINALMVFGTMAVPVLYVLLLQPVLYNGWRHFFFIWPPMAILAIGGFVYIRDIVQKTRFRKVPGIVMIVIIAVIGLRSWSYHPYEWSYFNLGFEKYAENNFEKDYWATSVMDSFEYAIEQKEEEPIKLTVPFWYYTYYWLENKYGDSFTNYDAITDQEVDYIIYHQPAGSIFDPAWNSTYFKPKENILDVNGITLGATVYGLWDQYSYSNVIEKTDNRLVENISDITWEKGIDKKNVCLTGKLNTPIFTKKIAIEVSNKKIAKNMRVFIKGSDEKWVSADSAGLIDIKNHMMIIRLSDLFEVTGIRIEHKTTPKEELRFDVNLYRKTYMKDTDFDLEQESPFEVVASTSAADGHITEYAIDNNNKTSWSSAEPQKQEMVYAFTLKKNYSLCGIGMLYENEWYNYPRNLRIFISADEKEWMEVAYEQQGNKLFTFAPVKGKYVRLVLGETEEIENHWSISELILYEEK